MRKRYLRRAAGEAPRAMQHEELRATVGGDTPGQQVRPLDADAEAAILRSMQEGPLSGPLQAAVERGLVAAFAADGAGTAALRAAVTTVTPAPAVGLTTETAPPASGQPTTTRTLPDVNWIERISARSATNSAPKSPRSFARAIQCIGGALAGQRSGQFRTPEQVAQEQFGADDPLVDAFRAQRERQEDIRKLSRSLNLPADLLNTVTGADGGFLVPEAQSAEFIEALWPQLLLGQVPTGTLGLTGGELVATKMTGGATAAFIGEGGKYPLTSASFGKIKEPARKVGCIVPMTDEWLAYSTPGSDKLVERDMIRATKFAIDSAFLRSQGNNGEPKGLRYLADPANVFAATTPVTIPSIEADLSKALLKLKRANLIMDDFGWLLPAGAEEYLANLRDTTGQVKAFPSMEQGKLARLPFVGSNLIPEDLSGGTLTEVYGVNWGDVLVAMEPIVQVKLYDQATALGDDDEVISAMQHGVQFLRVTMIVTWIVRHAKAITVITTPWGV